ncbi:cytosolic sulfotransferase 3-like [Paramormyrops kingsleyae]|uniref:Sulfotransferase n=1 Tax=Paramormyrops kingsleyae TaxID=1676925 RepID=A0A3B3SJE9_9TELE|nr:cytosolic sulfotransferase 3-like isoform X3 [Paramormyrops kingsleyae]XP_023675071.1 cytosolic sulfotransferase 3-like isoform X3 [Paramormyrops kingsleyae]XP_023675072.1 cytosolic sulfotransferase 3-like isoform X3 [Paramormyrops kingsleyae]
MELSRPELFDFCGVSMIHCFTENWDKVQNFKARPDDIVIATYAKAGTTWVSQILDLLYFGKSDPGRQTSIPIYERVPFLEMSIPKFFMGAELAEKMTTVPRIIKTHFPVQFMPKSFWEENCKIIYVARNAKDNVVSFFHFDRMNMVQPEPGDWPSYLQRFQEGKVVFGSWYDHVKGWWEKKQTYANIHYMFYEDLIEDTAQEIEKICSFLNISPTQEEKGRVRREVGFDAMKKNEMTNYSTLGVFDFKISPFMRKGKVSDWKNHFTVAQKDFIKLLNQKKMTNTTLRFRTEI